MNILLKGPSLRDRYKSRKETRLYLCTNTLFLPIAISREGQVFDRKSEVSPLL